MKSFVPNVWVSYQHVNQGNLTLSTSDISALLSVTREEFSLLRVNVIWLDFALRTLILHLLSQFWNSLRLLSSANVAVVVFKFVGMLTVKITKSSCPCDTPLWYSVVHVKFTYVYLALTPLVKDSSIALGLTVYFY